MDRLPIHSSVCQTFLVEDVARVEIPYIHFVLFRSRFGLFAWDIVSFVALFYLLVKWREFFVECRELMEREWPLNEDVWVVNWNKYKVWEPSEAFPCTFTKCFWRSSTLSSWDSWKVEVYSPYGSKETNRWRFCCNILGTAFSGRQEIQVRVLRTSAMDSCKRSFPIHSSCDWSWFCIKGFFLLQTSCGRRIKSLFNFQLEEGRKKTWIKKA